MFWKKYIMLTKAAFIFDQKYSNVLEYCEILL